MTLTSRDPESVVDVVYRPNQVVGTPVRRNTVRTSKGGLKRVESTERGGKTVYVPKGLVKVWCLFVIESGRGRDLRLLV